MDPSERRPAQVLGQHARGAAAEAARLQAGPVGGLWWVRLCGREHAVPRRGGRADRGLTFVQKQALAIATAVAEQDQLVENVGRALQEIAFGQMLEERAESGERMDGEEQGSVPDLKNLTQADIEAMERQTIDLTQESTRLILRNLLKSRSDLTVEQRDEMLKEAIRRHVERVVKAKEEREKAISATAPQTSPAPVPQQQQQDVGAGALQALKQAASAPSSVLQDVSARMASAASAMRSLHSARSAGLSQSEGAPAGTGAPRPRVPAPPPAPAKSAPSSGAGAASSSSAGAALSGSVPAGKAAGAASAPGSTGAPRRRSPPLPAAEPAAQGPGARRAFGGGFGARFAPACRARSGGRRARRLRRESVVVEQDLRPMADHERRLAGMATEAVCL